MPLDINHIWVGGHDQKPSLKLRAGKLSAIYENGNLRYISSGGIEIIRMIYPALRDEEWLTVKPVITSEWIENGSLSFRIEYQCLYRSKEIYYSARYLIEGFPDNTITFSFEGEALESFKKCRIGFCVLHPVDKLAGKPCTIIHSDESNETCRFPVLIDPLQPFKDIRSMRWATDNNEYCLEFSGEIFETEDQRNWTDASYKTYCTPQHLPAPVTVRKGEKISQKVKFLATIDNSVSVQRNQQVRIIAEPEVQFLIPKIGIGRSTRSLPLTINEMQLLKNIRFDHYRADLYMFSDDWMKIANLAAKEAQGMGYALELALFFDNDFNRQIFDFIGWVKSGNPIISVILLLHKTMQVTPIELVSLATPLLKKNIPDLITAYGTNANFAQINFDRPESAPGDILCYSIHPQEHASDNTTLRENLQAQGNTVESASRFSDGKGIWISPINIQRRFNANTENFEMTEKDDSYPSQADSRLMSLFGACWTTGSLKYICESGATGATYYETAGERGIIQGDFPSRWPEKFQSIPGMIFPAAFVLRFLLEAKSFKLIKSTSSHPLEIESLILSDGKNTRIIAVNMTSERQDISIEGITGSAGLRQMHAGNYHEALSDLNWTDHSPLVIIRLNDTLLMEPFSVSFINTEWNITDI